ncbi:MAG: flagellar motor switch protein FliN [Alphaproteobacteria bacterium]|nr:flagellar motor switch protein FliN [Alphaproteobacteria bacterium]
MSTVENEKIDQEGAPQASVQNLKLLENIEVKLTVEVGGTRIIIRDLLKLNEGSIVELDRLAGEHLDILVNGTLLAKGEIVLIGESLGIRFTEIISPEQRLRSI